VKIPYFKRFGKASAKTMTFKKFYSTLAFSNRINFCQIASK